MLVTSSSGSSPHPVPASKTPKLWVSVAPRNLGGHWGQQRKPLWLASYFSQLWSEPSPPIFSSLLLFLSSQGQYMTGNFLSIDSGGSHSCYWDAILWFRALPSEEEVRALWAGQVQALSFCVSAVSSQAGWRSLAFIYLCGLQNHSLS